MKYRRKSKTPCRARGFSMPEMMIALVLSAIILAAVYQTMRLQWRSLAKSSEEAQLQGESRRALAFVAKQLRNSGFNPLNTDFENKDPAKRIGLLAAYGDSLSFSSDTVDAKGSGQSDGIINSVATLDGRMMPVAGKSDARELGGLRQQKDELQYFTRVDQVGKWQTVADGVERFAINYFAANNKQLSAPALQTNFKKLKAVERIELTLKLKKQLPSGRISNEATVAVSLRNPPALTATETP